MDAGDLDWLVTYGINGAIPVVGDWNSNGIDNVGFFVPTGPQAGQWAIDVNGNETVDAPDILTEFLNVGRSGVVPVTGDWNADGDDDIGLFYAGYWGRDMNGDGVWNDASSVVTFGSPGDTPIVGNWPATPPNGRAVGLKHDSGTGVMSADLPLDVRRPLDPNLIDAAFASDWYDYLLQ